MLQLLDGRCFDLANALARNAVLGRKLFEPNWLLLQATPLQDPPLPLAERFERALQTRAALGEFLAFGKLSLFIGPPIDEPIQQLFITIGSSRRIEREVRPE